VSILSYKKTLQTIKNSFSEILSILRSDMKIAIKLMENIYLIFSENHWRERRKGRENFVDNIELFICKKEK